MYIIQTIYSTYYFIRIWFEIGECRVEIAETACFCNSETLSRFASRGAPRLMSESKLKTAIID